ncbi:MAG: DNA polymerase III subunit beta [Bacillota bacterium]|nr:DNA polymerase III subunit beta [Bacillota bacterium]
MRLTVDKEQFLKALNTANKAVASKSPIQTMTSLKLELSDKGLEVTGTNGDITIRTIVPYKIGEKQVIKNFTPGATLVSAKILVEVVRKVSGEELVMDVIDDAILKVDDGRSSFKLNCQNADEFVDVDLEPAGTTFEISATDLTALVEQSAFAASNKEQRPILKALHLEAENGRLIATATDSARLARKVVPVDPEARFVCNIPARIALDIVHMLDTAPAVRVSVSSNKALFEFDGATVSSRLTQGDYPLTRSIIPSTFNDTLEVNAQELLAALERVRILSNDSEPAVKISMSEEEIELSARSDNSGSANEKIATFNYVGDDLEVSFNSQFVIDAVKAVKAEDVTICFLGQMKPFVVKNPKDDSVVELITPMRIN